MTFLFKPMLAESTDDLKQPLTFPKLASPKLDGIRCVISGGVAYSRSGKPIRNEFIQDMIANCATVLEGLDGELIVGSPTDPEVFKNSTSGVMSIDGAPEFTFHVFDWFHPTLAFEYRLEHIVGLSMILPKWVRIVPQIAVYTQEELKSLEEQALEEGYEGLMLKNQEGLYKQGRATAKSQDLLKVKVFKDMEAVVVDMTEEMHNTNEAKKDALGHTERSSDASGLVPKGTLGALVVKGLNGPFKDVEFSLGTGYTANARKVYWEIRDSLVGRIVKVKYFPTDTDKPRFPVFLGFRDSDDMS